MTLTESSLRNDQFGEQVPEMTISGRYRWPSEMASKGVSCTSLGERFPSTLQIFLGLLPRTGSGGGDIKAGSIALSWEFVLGFLEIFALSSTSFFQRERARKTVRPKSRP